MHCSLPRMHCTHTCQVTLDISGHPIENQRGSQKYPGKLDSSVITQTKTPAKRVIHVLHLTDSPTAKRLRLWSSLCMTQTILNICGREHGGQCYVSCRWGQIKFHSCQLWYFRRERWSCNKFDNDTCWLHKLCNCNQDIMLTTKLQPCDKELDGVDRWSASIPPTPTAKILMTQCGLDLWPIKKPCHDGDHVCQIGRESIQNCTCCRTDMARCVIFWQFYCKFMVDWPWRYRSRSKVIVHDILSC